MHILLIHQAFAALDEAGGTRHFEMAEYLARSGHRITIIASPVSYITGKARGGKVHWVERQKISESIQILRTYTYPALHRSFFHRVLSFLSFMVSSFLVGWSVRQVDLVWGTSPPLFQGITAWILARLKRVPFLFEVRDLWPSFAVAVGVLKNPLLITASRGLERFLYRHADRVMVNSPGFIDHVSQNGARWVELIPNGVDPAMFDPQADGREFRQQHNFGDHFVALYAGAHGLANDLGVLLQAAAQLRCQEQILFVLVGDGKEKAALQTQARTQELSNVVFLPSVSKAEMCAVLAAADACLAILKPIKEFATTYPNKVFDYMAAGKPVVLVIDGVIRQVVEQAGAGVAVPPGDSQALAAILLQLAQNPDRAHQMGLAGREYVTKYFNRSELSEKLALLLEEMRGGNG